MSAESPFDMKLTNLFLAYADRAPVEVEARGLAHAIASSGSRTTTIFGRTFMRPRWLVPVLVTLLLLAALAAAAIVGAQLLQTELPGPDPYRGVVEPLGKMTVGRLSPLVAELPDGRVLIAGGFGDEIPAELFDPTTATTRQLDGPTPTGQYGSSVQLPGGKVLMLAHNDNYTDSRAWVFDSATESFHEIEQPGQGNAPPFGVRPDVAGLRDGRVLVVGGTNDAMTAKPSVLASAMLFDPVSETFAPTGSMSVPRVTHSTTALADGRVLVAGGWIVWPERVSLSQYVPGQPTTSAEIYDPDTGAFTPTGSMPSVVGPNMAVALPDGRVLVMSAPVERSDDLPPRPPVAMDIYDPASGEFTALPQLSLAIDDAVVLRDGRVLLSGTEVQDRPELDPQGGFLSGPFDVPWASIYTLSNANVEQVAPRSAKNPGMTVLSDGTVLYAGGWSYMEPGGDTQILDSVEVFR